MGLSTALYRRSLLSTGSVDLPSSQCIYFAFWLSCFLSDLMRFEHASLLSDACPSVSLHFSEVDQLSSFVLSDRFGYVG
jgi:hypothetical protein